MILDYGGTGNAQLSKKVENSASAVFVVVVVLGGFCLFVF